MFVPEPVLANVRALALKGAKKAFSYLIVALGLERKVLAPDGLRFVFPVDGDVVCGRDHDAKLGRGKEQRLREIGLFGDFSLCLSRACLV